MTLGKLVNLPETVSSFGKQHNSPSWKGLVSVRDGLNTGKIPFSHLRGGGAVSHLALSTRAPELPRTEAKAVGGDPGWRLSSQGDESCLERMPQPCQLRKVDLGEMVT